MRSSLLLLLTTLWLAGCAATTEFMHTSHEAAPSHSVNSLIVAGVTPDDSMRRLYEQTFLNELRKSGITGIASSELIPSLTGLDMETLRARMLQFSNHADAVLHVQLMGLVRTPALSPTDIPSDLPSASKRIGGIDFTINAPSSQNTQASLLQVEISSNLYELPERRLLWTGNSSTHEGNDPRQIARSHARAVIAELRAGGYLAGNR